MYLSPLGVSGSGPITSLPTWEKCRIQHFIKILNSTVCYIHSLDAIPQAQLAQGGVGHWIWQITPLAVRESLDKLSDLVIHVLSVKPV